MCLSSVAQVVSNSLRPHGLQHTRPPCPSPTPGACSNSCLASRWCHPTISSSVIPFSSCLQSFPASGCFPMMCSVTQLCPTPCDPMDCRPPGSSVHGDSPGKDAGVGCHSLLQGTFPTQGSNPGLPHCRWILYYLGYQGSPMLMSKFQISSISLLMRSLQKYNNAINIINMEVKAWILLAIPIALSGIGHHVLDSLINIRFRERLGFEIIIECIIIITSVFTSGPGADFFAPERVWVLAHSDPSVIKQVVGAGGLWMIFTSWDQTTLGTVWEGRADGHSTRPPCRGLRAFTSKETLLFWWFVLSASW